MSGTFRYDRSMILLHWLTALLIAVAWVGAQVIDLFPRAARPPVLSVHLAVGLAVGLLLLGRAMLRFGGRAVLPPAEPGLLERAGRATHLLLYALLAALVVLGLANAWARADSLFGLVSLSAVPAERGLRRTIGGLHELAANAILVVAGLHAAAALFHHYVLRDGVLRRMLPQG